MCNFRLDDTRCHEGFPRFDANFRYLGPLPRDCGHVHSHKLVGKDNNQWKTAPSAAYPAGMCEFIAHSIFVAVASSGGGAETGNRSMQTTVGGLPSSSSAGASEAKPRSDTKEPLCSVRSPLMKSAQMDTEAKSRTVCSVRSPLKSAQMDTEAKSRNVTKASSRSGHSPLRPAQGDSQIQKEVVVVEDEDSTAFDLSLIHI